MWQKHEGHWHGWSQIDVLWFCSDQLSVYNCAEVFKFTGLLTIKKINLHLWLMGNKLSPILCGLWDYSVFFMADFSLTLGNFLLWMFSSVLSQRLEDTSAGVRGSLQVWSHPFWTTTHNSQPIFDFCRLWSWTLQHRKTTRLCLGPSLPVLQPGNCLPIIT